MPNYKKALCEVCNKVELEEKAQVLCDKCYDDSRDLIIKDLKQILAAAKTQKEKDAILLEIEELGETE